MNILLTILLYGPHSLRTIFGNTSHFILQIKAIQAIDESKKSIRGVYRKLKKHNFYITKKNGISVPRTWLIYSPSNVSVFCYICKLYAKTSKHLLCKEGYSDWHHITERLVEHENLTTHRNAICDYSNRSVELKRIDCQLVKEYKTEVQYWRNILKRTIAVIQFISQRGLAFFRDNEILDNSHNGNFRYYGIISKI